MVVQGVADIVDDPEVLHGLEGLGLDSWALAGADVVTWVRIRAETITGRRALPGT